MSNLSELDMTAADNNGAPPNGAPEGMLAGKVNDVIRELMSAIAKYYQDQRGSLTTAGSGNAYTLTTNQTHTALSDQSILCFRVDRANTDNVTLNVDGLGAKYLYKGSPLHEYESGELKAGQMLVAVYNPTGDHYEVIGPQNPVPVGYKHGLICSNGSDADHDLNITAGSCCDDDGTGVIVLAGALAGKQLDAAWAAGAAAGMLDAGSIALDTTYHIFAIRNPTTGAVDALASTSASSPTMPSGYTQKRRIHSVMTDASANIYAFWRVGDHVWWAAEGSDQIGGGEQTAAITRQLETLNKIPAGVRVRPIVQVELEVDGEWTIYAMGPPDDATGSNDLTFTVSAAANRTEVCVTLPFYCNTSAQVYHSLNDGTDDLDVYVRGYVDDLDRMQ